MIQARRAIRNRKVGRSEHEDDIRGTRRRRHREIVPERLQQTDPEHGGHDTTIGVLSSQEPRPGSLRKDHDRPRTMVRPFATLLALAVTAAAPGAAPAEAQAANDAVTVISPAGRQRIAVTDTGGTEMVALDDLARLLQLDIREDSRAGTLSVTGRGGGLIMTPGQQIVSVDGRLVSLRAAPRQDGGRWLVPLDALNRALGPVSGQSLEFRARRKLLLVGDVRVPRVSAAYRAGPARGRLSLEVVPAVEHAIERQGGRLVVTFDADAIDLEGAPDLRGGLVTRFALAEGAAGVTIDLGPDVDTYDVSREPAPGGGATLQIDVLARRAAAGPDPVPAPAPTLPARTDLLPEFSTGPAVRIAVIDPGHGGADHGSEGASGALEKDITLAIAGQLREAIENRIGLRVILTRGRDETVAPDTRAAIANNNAADLFISLHVNASARPAADGTAVYYLSIDEYGAEAREIADREIQPVPVVGGGSREIDLIRWEMAQIRYVGQSGRLADMVEEELGRRVLLSPHPAQQAPLRVLVGANMPAVLVELGSISDPEAEERLTSAVFQAGVVDAIVAGIRRYSDDLDRARQFAPRLPEPDRSAGTARQVRER